MVGMGWVSKICGKEEEGCVGRGVWERLVRRRVKNGGNGVGEKKWARKGGWVGNFHLKVWKCCVNSGCGGVNTPPTAWFSGWEPDRHHDRILEVNAIC
jgi:hypothetical protein